MVPDLHRSPSDRRRVAVVGGGVAGLTAAWALRSTHRVTLFEADDRLGGHAHTHDVVAASGGTVAVDTGFMVHNARTYPTLTRLLGELGVESRETDMSLAVCCDGCGLRYSGGQGAHRLGLVPSVRRRDAVRYLGMLGTVPRFHARARALLDDPADDDDITLGEFLRDGRFSPYFVGHF